MANTLHETESRLLRISSKNRSVDSINPYSIVFTTNDNDLHQIKHIVLKSAIIPNTQYNINSNNNIFTYKRGAVLQTLTIPPLQYNINEFIIAFNLVAAADNLVLSLVGDRLGIADTNTTDFTILPFVTDSPESNALGDVMGINIEQTGNVGNAYTLVMDGLPDFSGLQNVYISSQALSNHTPMIGNDKQKQNVFCNIPITVEFGGIQVHDENRDSLDYSIFHSRKNISSIDIRLLNEDDTEVDLNGNDWVLIFRVYT